MNGDEDLGEDITMKGDKFHFKQTPNNSKIINFNQKYNFP